MNKEEILKHARWYANDGFVPLLVPAVNRHHGNNGETTVICRCELGARCPNPGKHRLRLSIEGIENIEHCLHQALPPPQKFNLALKTGRAGGIFAFELHDPENNWHAFETKHSLNLTGIENRSWDGYCYLIFPYPRHSIIHSRQSHPAFELGGVHVIGENGLILVHPSSHAYGDNEFVWNQDYKVEDPAEIERLALILNTKAMQAGDSYRG